MFNFVLPEFMKLITMVATGTGFIVLVFAIGETVYRGFFEGLKNIRE